MARKRIVIALGHRALGANLPEQKEAVAKTTRVIADFIQERWQVTLAHSNTPQVSMIHAVMNEFGKQHEGYTSTPMSAYSTMSQGYIGYDLWNSVHTELVKRRIYKPVATALIQMIVGPYDEAFYIPVKPVERYMAAEEAKEEEEKGNYVGEVPGKGFRRMVVSPKPVAIMEINVIKAVLDTDQIVTVCGGGGVPVMEQGYNLKDVSAVTEKDRAAGLLAKEIDADVLMILASVDSVTLNYGRASEKSITAMGLEDAKAYIGEEQFEFASILPKIETSIDFITHRNGQYTIITSMEQAKASLSGKAETTIHQSFVSIVWREKPRRPVSDL